MARTAERYVIMSITHDKRSGDIFADLMGIYKTREAAVAASKPFYFMNVDNSLMSQTVKVVSSIYFNE